MDGFNWYLPTYICNLHMSSLAVGESYEIYDEQQCGLPRVLRQYTHEVHI